MRAGFSSSKNIVVSLRITGHPTELRVIEAEMIIICLREAWISTVDEIIWSGLRQILDVLAKNPFFYPALARLARNELPSIQVNGEIIT